MNGKIKKRTSGERKKGESGTFKRLIVLKP
jgi:hypothetical protein